GTVAIAEEIASSDSDRTIIAPFVWVADLVHHSPQLRQCLLFRLGTHPGELSQIFLHRFIDLLGHGQRARLRIGSECLLRKNLAERFAEVTINVLHASLPTRLILGNAAQILAVKIEIGANEGGGKIRGLLARQMPAQIGFPVRDAVALEQGFRSEEHTSELQSQSNL